MARADWIIKTSEYRPCYVDGDRALFHRWVEEERRNTYGVVEYENGEIALVSPDHIKFADSRSRFDEIAWNV